MILGIAGNQGESFDFTGNVNMDLRPDYRLVKPAEVHGVCIRTGENAYVVSGSLYMQLSGTCAKCAMPATAELTVQFEERFVKEPNDDETYPFTGDEIDLTQALSDNAFLALPGRILCKQDCKGLCPICGTDLNEAECLCTADDKNPFAVLRQLKLPEEE